MRVLFISPRFPWPPYSGDRLRATIWLGALASHAEVALAAPPGEVPRAISPGVKFYPATRSGARALRAALAVVLRRLPVQSLLAAPYAWPKAIGAARREHGGFDATVVLLPRTDPWVRSCIDGGLRVLDAIDSLGKNAAERARAASPFKKWFWRREERRLDRAESEMSAAYDRVIVVSDAEVEAFGSSAVAIGNGVDVTPLDVDAPRSYDFGFWGRLKYFANADAARWLIEEIWPRIRAIRPDVTLVIGGAAAPRALSRLAAERGVTLISPVEDIPAFARRIRIAILPLRYGSGQSTKVMEAAEGGCAVAATTHAMRGLPHLAEHALIANAAQALAKHAMTLLTDTERRKTLATALRRAVEMHHSRETTYAALRKVIGVGG